ncbi:MAG: ATP-binding protein [Coriobacteriia bacterium]|nr:ATP-binding protein [Coriobacteriia bacterium]MBN2841362.1 ATP-binding protein [Coriobacteriia bacterium]
MNARSIVGRLTVAIASGKGGTGKTLVATNLAVAAARAGSPVTLVDCDADAPNDALFLAPAEPQVREVTVPLPVVDADTCTLCGACRATCVYGAIRILGGAVMVFPELCHNCGACVKVCRPGALSEEPVRVGEVEWGRVAASIASPAGVDVVTGRLDIGEVKTPTVIRAARRQADVLHKPLTVLDSPPGVACAAVAAMRDADVLVLVTEPTPFGLHDLELAVDLGREMGIPLGVVVNRDIGATSEVDAYCEREGIPVLARIPFDRRVAEVYASGGLVIDGHPDGVGWFDGLWHAVRDLAEEDA